MRTSSRSAGWCLLAMLAACAGTGPAPPERDVIEALFDLPAEQRDPAIAAFLRAGRPRLLIEAAPREPLEAEYGGLLPAALDDFEILRVVVAFDEPDVNVGAALAIVPVPRDGAGVLPIYTPTRDLLVAFTGERRAGSHTYYRLTSAGLPWYVNMLTAGALEIASVGLKQVTIEPDEEAHDRAAPKAKRLADLLSRSSCPWRGGPCEVHLLVPRPRDDVPLRIDLELELHGTRLGSLHLPWSATLPGGKPLAARLADLFHGAPIELADARVERVGADAPERCRLRQPQCATQTARAAPPVTTPVAAPAQLATPAESQAARPTWSEDEGYAPGATIDVVAPDALIAGGPLRDALLVCDLDAGGTKLSQLVVETRAGALPVHRPPLFEVAGRPRFVVPLVQLAPGESLSVAAWWRTHSWFWGTSEGSIGKLQAKYDGTLPIAVKSRRLGVSCVALGREAIEAQVTTRLAALEAALAEFDVGVEPISELRKDWGLGSWGMAGLQRHVESVAGLVGWSDPRVRAVLPALEHYHAMFVRRLGRLFAAKQASLPPPGQTLSFADGDMRVIGSACGDQIDRRRVLWAREKVGEHGCVTIVEVIGRGPKLLKTSPRTGSIGPLFSLELAWADGRRSDAWAVGVEPPPGKRRDPEHLNLAAGETARFYLAPERPYHRADGPAPLFLLGRAGDQVYVRLQ